MGRTTAAARLAPSPRVVWPLSAAGVLAVAALALWLAAAFGELQLGAETLAALRSYA